VPSSARRPEESTVGDVIGVLQARMSSTRLPGKILAPLAGRPLLEVLLRRLSPSRRVAEWWVATTDTPSDDVTAAWGRALGVRVFRGAVDDVLSRYTAIVRQRSPEWVVRLTADDPFTDAAVVDLLVERAQRGGAGVALVQEDQARRTLPLGYCQQVARADALLEAERRIAADQPWHRTHVLTWVAEHLGVTSLEAPADWPARPDWRWTVDTPDDLALADAAFRLLGPRADVAGYPEVAALFDAHPALAVQNRGTRQKGLTEG